LIPVW